MSATSFCAEAANAEYHRLLRAERASKSILSDKLKEAARWEKELARDEEAVRRWEEQAAANGIKLKRPGLWWFGV